LRTRVLGLGSPFGDDRVAWRLVEDLRGSVPNDVELLTLDRPGAALVQWMAGVDHLVLIDAVFADGAPGRVIEIRPDDLNDKSSVVSSHQLPLRETLALAATLGCLPRRVTILGVTVNIQGLTDSRYEAAGTGLRRRLLGLLDDAT
jgi:hydrogenase maturation protease